MKKTMKSMNMYRKSFRVLLLILLGISFNATAQLMNFSQYQMSPMLNNPSLIAKGEELKVDFGYRNQFGGLSGNFGTPFLSAYKPLYLLGKDDAYKKFGAAGVQFVNDRTGYNGSLATTGFSVTYAHIANLSKREQLILGLSAGFYQRRVDFGNLTSGNQWDSFNGAFDASKPLNENLTATERRSFPLVNAGVTYIRNNAEGKPFISVSLAANSLNSPNVSLNKGESLRPASINFQGSIAAYETKTLLLQPTFRHIQEGKLNQTNLGSYLYYKMGENAGIFSNGNIGLGLWYSNQNALITALEVNMKDWALGLSYDFLVSSLSQQDNRTGAPELIVGFRKFVGKIKKESPVPVVVPVQQEEKQAPSEVKPQEPSKPVEEIKKEEPARQPEKELVKEEVKKEEAQKEEPKKEEPAKAEVKKPAAEERQLSPEEQEKERARKRQVYMVPLGFRGKDPFGGSGGGVTLSKQDRAFLSKSVKFKRNGSDITPASAKHLDNVARVLRKHPNMKIEIRGFGCDLGSDEVNLLISQSRSDQVKAYLVKRKVNPRQLNAVGLGKLKPEDDIKVD
jgi:type IX secretion system PorP/SprF family membrane protein